MKGVSNSITKEFINFYTDSSARKAWSKMTWAEWLNSGFNRYNEFGTESVIDTNISASIDTLTQSVSETIGSGSLATSYTQTTTISFSVNGAIDPENNKMTIDYSIPWTKSTNDRCAWTLTYSLTYETVSGDSHTISSGTVNIASTTTSGTQTGSVDIPTSISGTLKLTATFKNNSYTTYTTTLEGSADVTINNFTYICKTVGSSKYFLFNNDKYVQPTDTISDGITYRVDIMTLDYIQSSGTQYIKSGVLCSINSKVILEYASTDTTATNKGIMGVNIDSKRLQIYQSATSGSETYGLGDGYALRTADTNKHIVELDAKNVKVTFDGAQLAATTGTFSNNVSVETEIYVFAVNNGSAVCGYVKIYSLKIYDNDVLVRDFVPCVKVSSDEKGLYDSLNNVFYGNAGTGSFV